MIVNYDVNCFYRELQVIFPNGYENYRYDELN